MSGDFDSNNGSAENYISSNERAYFFITPNIVDDMDLSVYAFRLYCHIKRVAGEVGACWQSTSTLAERCKMSAGKVSDAKQELVEVGLIQIENKQDKNLIYHHITINDIWRENMERYISVQEVNGNGNQRSPHERYRSPHERQRSPGETKKNPIKKDQENKNQKEEEEEEAAVAVAKSRAIEPEPKPAAAATTTYPEELALWFEKQSSINGKEVNLEIAKAAAEQWLLDIANSGKKWHAKNYECIRERYARLEAQAKEKAKYDFAYSNDSDTFEEEDYQDSEPEPTFPKEESILALAVLDIRDRGWQQAFKVIGVNGKVQIGVSGKNIEEAKARFSKTFERQFMQPVAFEVMQ